MFDFRRGVAGGVWGRSDGAVPVGNELDCTDRRAEGQVCSSAAPSLSRLPRPPGPEQPFPGHPEGFPRSSSFQRLIPQRTGDYTETQMPWTWRNGYGFLGYAYIFACTTTNQPKCISILDSSDMHGFFLYNPYMDIRISIPGG